MLRLALMGDLHYPLIEQANRELFELREGFYFNFLKSFLDLEADLHISLGDLTHNGLMQEFEEVYHCIRTSPVSFRHVLGNHDAYAMSKAQISSVMDHPPYEALETEEALLVFLDSTRELQPQDWSGDLDAQQLEWLESQIQRNPDKPILIFAHHPVYDTTHMSRENKMHIDPLLDIPSILGKRNGIGLYFNGHNHTHSIVHKEGWSFIQTAACLCDPSFRIVEIDSGQIQTRVNHVEDPEILQHAHELFKKLPGYHAPMNAHGEPSDRNCSILLPQRKAYSS
ncbi:metallophosphoesterase [Paenibacillus filicis]|uniref:Metallophosphoesterase n=1 Tax=Paenibacillus gyeongsangnamensis TaxID=3388067 RepID=A0ABT4QF03_9BACL|nr:metallophosphoesterase [Paenibacillus filicis]MCZ8515453.1 metallophosphoesterase [Paenibacillus filicis]